MLADWNPSFDTLAIALIAAVVTPGVLQWRAERQHRIERQEAREDREQAKKDAAQAKAAAEMVAQKAEEAARLLAERQDAEEARQRGVADQAAEAAKLLLESNHRVAARSEALAEQITANTEQTVANATKLDALDAKTDRIGMNTDGALTKTMRGTLAAVENSLATLRTLASERKDKGGTATQETELAIHAAETEAAALRAEITMRLASPDDPAFTPPHGVPVTGP